MKTTAVALSIFFSVLISIPLQSQKPTTYKHPLRDFSFSAAGEWEQNTHHKDKMIYEMVNPEQDLHVMLWYNGGTESSCERYLKKMAGMKGLESEEPVEENYDGKTVWVLICRDGEDEVRVLAALSYVKNYGKDAPERCQGKTYNAMHIAQVWCPASEYQENKETIDGIIAGLELKEQ